MKRAESETLWYPSGLDLFLNRWFASYEEARQALQREGGFLLPYRHQFFICQADAIQAMGLDPSDPDWERIGWDAAQPADREACQRLYEQRERVAQEQGRG